MPTFVPSIFSSTISEGLLMNLSESPSFICLSSAVPREPNKCGVLGYLMKSPCDSPMGHFQCFELEWMEDIENSFMVRSLFECLFSLAVCLPKGISRNATQAITVCPICGSLYNEARHKGVTSWSSFDHEIFDCRKCNCQTTVTEGDGVRADGFFFALATCCLIILVAIDS